MNKSFPIRTVIIVAITILAPLVGFLIWDSMQFKVVNITPDTSKPVSTSTSVIRIEFNKPLSNDGSYDRSIVTDPQLIVRDIEKEDSAIILQINALKQDYFYELTMHDIYSNDGQVIDIINLSFNATYIPFNKLPREQQQQETLGVDPNYKEDPLLAYLPHSTLSYTLYGSHEMNHEGEYAFILNANILLTAADVRIDKQAAIDRAKKQINDYIASKGLNPVEYQIRYTVVE